MSKNKKNRDTRSIVKEIEIDAPVEAVWKALIDAEELTRWFPLDADVKPGLGGKIRISWGEKFEWGFRIEIWVTEKHLRLVYNHETDFIALDEQDTKKEKVAKERKLVTEEPHKLAIDYFLKARVGKTVLRLVHSGFGADANWHEEYDSVSRGWDTELINLRHYLEHHPGKNRTVAWARIGFQQPLDLTWKRLMGTNGLVHKGILDGLGEGDIYNIQTVNGDLFQGVVQYFNPPANNYI